MAMSLPTYGALSATSANVIRGSEPSFVELAAAKKLGFFVNNVEFSESEGNISPTDVKEFYRFLKLGDFSIKTLTAADIDYFDIDGDEPAVLPFTIGTQSYEWFEADDTKIEDMNKMVGCGNNFKYPLKLKITVEDIQAHSEYGLPRAGINTTLVKEYSIAPEEGICYARPNSLDWRHDTYPPDTEGFIDEYLGGGYRKEFDPDNGFIATNATKFPTTGFPGAQFKLVMTGPASDYSFDLIENPNGAAQIDSSTGMITLKEKPMGTGNITVRVIKTNSQLPPFDYTFNPTSVWALPQLGTAKFYDSAVKCGGSTANFLKRVELTNGVGSASDPPRNNPNGGIAYFTRAIGEGVLAEWGTTVNGVYPKSDWSDELYAMYWTPEFYSGVNEVFIVMPYDGYYGDYTITDPTRVYSVCRG
ncbi:hypothetical protein RCS94_07980 [Orbaceae bacterium ac157xtp]